MSAPLDHPSPRRVTPAFSRPLKVDDLPDEGLATRIEANPAECLAVSEEIDIPAIAAFAASFKVTRQPGARVQVDGEVKARITQVCVVSLEPFESDVVQPVAIAFAQVKASRPERQRRQRTERDGFRRGLEESLTLPTTVPGDGEADPPDPIVDGRIDLGTVAVEFLTLALDFYPKKPGVHFNDVVIGETDEPQVSAFAALGRFKDRS